MELILKRISDLPEQAAADLTGEELVIVGNNGVLELVPLSAIYANAQSQLDNVANLSVVTLADIQDQNFTDTYITYPLLAQAIQSLGLLLTPNQQQAFLQHLVNYNNPHRVTAEQVGLGNVSNLPILTESDLEANNYGNKYITYNILQAAAESLGFNDLSNVANYPPTTLSDIQNGVFGQTYLTYNLLSQAVQSLNIVLPPLLRTEFLAHLTNYNNPHETTADQVGLGNVVNLPVLTQADITAGNTSLEAYVTYNLLQAAVNSLPNTGILTASQKTAFLAHLVNYDNPHQVTAEQVGLGKVANLPPISQTDINNVSNGATPPDVYLTYNLLEAANISLGFYTSSGIYISLTITNITDTSMTFNAFIENHDGSALGDYQLTFTYYPTNNPNEAVTTSPISYSQAVNNVISSTEGSLSEGTSYTVYATLTNPNNNEDTNVSGKVTNSTLGTQTTTTTTTTTTPTSSSTSYSFDIVGAGSSDTTEFDSTTVDGSGGSFSGNTYVASATGNSAISTISDPSGDANFTSCSAQISFKPGAFITPQSGSTATNVVLSESDYNTLSSGEVLGVIVNGSIVNATIGTNCQLAYTAATSSTETVPGGSTQGSPSPGSLLGSVTPDYVGTHTVGLRWDTVNTDWDSPTIIKTYSLSGSTPYQYNTTIDSSGIVSSSSVTPQYSLSSGIGSEVYATSGGSPDATDMEGGNPSLDTNSGGFIVPAYYWSVSNGTIYVYGVNQGTTTTYPSTTKTTTTPASYALTFNSGVLSAAPTSIFNNTSRKPVGVIGSSTVSSTGSNLIGSNSTTSNIYLNGPQTFTNGQVVQAIVNGNPVNLTIGDGVTYNTQTPSTNSTNSSSSGNSLKLINSAFLPTIIVPQQGDPGYICAGVQFYNNTVYIFSANPDGGDPAGSQTVYFETLFSVGPTGVVNANSAPSYSVTSGSGTGLDSSLGIWVYGTDSPSLNGAALFGNGTPSIGMQYESNYAWDIVDGTLNVYSYVDEYYLTLTTALDAVPTALYLTSPSSSGTLAALDVSSETYSSGVVTLDLAAFTGNGNMIQLGLQNLLSGDTLIELKGNVTQG